MHTLKLIHKLINNWDKNKKINSHSIEKEYTGMHKYKQEQVQKGKKLH